MLKTVFSLAACSVLLTLQSASAQEEVWDNARLQSEVEALKSSVGTVSKNVDALNKQIETIQENTDMAAELSMKLRSELSKFASKEDVATLGTAMNELTTAMNDQGVRQQNILNAISADDVEGNRYLRLDAILDNSEQGRSEFRSALERSVRSTGTLILVNKVGADRDVIVNGQQHTVRSGATLKVTVPTGTVNTRLPNGEEFNWTIGPANHYSQSIDILQRQTTYRPITQATTSVASISPAVSYSTYYSTGYNPGYTASYSASYAPSYSAPYYSGYSSYYPNYYSGNRWGRRRYSYYAY